MMRALVSLLLLLGCEGKSIEVLEGSQPGDCEEEDVTGVVGTSRGSMAVEYTLFHGLTYATCQGSCAESPSGTGCVVADPRFVDEESGDYHLDDFSPAVDAGNPASAYNDADGTRNDMGVYGGPYGEP